MMTPDRWTRIKEIFHTVADQPPAGRHSAVLRECQGDIELQHELEQLLTQDEEMGRFLEGNPVAGELATEPPSVLNPGELLADRYRIVRFLGAGGAGEVYEAEDELLKKTMALKVISRETTLGEAALEQLRREVQAAHKVTQNNVCRIYDLQRHQGQGHDVVFLTMELVQGETLLARLRRVGRLDPREALLVAEQLCQGIAAAHRAEVLHRDLKCSNVMLVGSGEAVRALVTDFGTALRLDPSGPAANPGAFYGTPAYSSPEQLQGEEPTRASDIYSLGLILYEMLTGRRPFRQNSQLLEAVKRLENDHKIEEPVPGINSSWNRIIQRCLARQPERRFPSAEAVEAALKRMGKERQILVWRTLAAAAAVAILGLGIFVGAFLLREEPRHVAVLPFRTLAGNSADRAFADGLAESLSNNLAELEISKKSLWVVPWSQIRPLPATQAVSRSSALGVDRFITGSLEERNGQWIVQMWLQEGSSHRPLATKVVQVGEGKLNGIGRLLLEQAASMLDMRVPAEVSARLSQQETPIPGAQEFYERGRGYLARYDLDSAMDQLKKATGKDPGFTAAYAYLAYAYALKFRTTSDRSWRDNFEQVYDRAAPPNTDLAPRHMARALVLRQKGDLPGSIQELERARELEPALEDVLFLLASAYDEAGRTADAEKLLKETIQQHSASWLSRDQLGAIYYSHARYDEAERYFREAADLAPDNPMAFVNLGAIRLVHGKPEDAIPFLQKAAALKQDAGAYSNLAIALLNLGRYPESIAAFEKAKDLLPHNHVMWRNLGDAYARAGNKGKAVDAYRGAIQESEKDLADRPHDSKVLENLSLYHAELGNKAKARLHLAQAVDLPKDPPSLFDLTLIYELIGEREKALGALRSTVKSGYPKSEIQNAMELEKLRKDKRYTEIMALPGP